MIRLKSWQWFILAIPIILLVSFFLIATGLQIHQWGINWIWAIFVIILVAWRWLLVKWTKPVFPEVSNIVKDLEEEVKNIPSAFDNKDGVDIDALENTLQSIISETRNDPPLWEDLQLFFERCQNLVTAIAKVYHPEVEYPLLNIYIPQAYGLIRGTVDDMDKWMTQLSPALNQVTIGQGYQGYLVYRKLEPSARKLLQVWNWAQWVINPVVAATKLASQETNKQANQELLINLNQVLREVALRNLARQASLLYGGKNLPLTFQSQETPLPSAKTKTLREIITEGAQPQQIEQKPVNILLVGRTGAGKSSLINTLFRTQQAEVDALPSTREIKSYQWQSASGDKLNLWDTPGYEQVNRSEYREVVLDYAQTADIILLLNPALDPALQMDRDFLLSLPEDLRSIPIFTVITQVDRTRPVREWQPPYNWQTGNLPKEISIREAVMYRQNTLGDLCQQVLPIVTANYGDSPRKSWQDDILALNILSAIAPAKQIRLARFFRNLEVKTTMAAKIIDKYTFQMATSQGLTALLKSPILQFLSTLTTGTPRLAYLLAEKIPIENLPVVIGKLQLAYELFNLLSENEEENNQFDLLSLWTLVVENNGLPEDDAWAFGHALVEFWTKKLTINELEKRYQFYLNKS